MAKYDVTKTLYSQKKLSTDFSEILVADVKLMPGKVLIVLRRYLPPFLGYQENPAGGGAIFAPSPSGARVKSWHSSVRLPTLLRSDGWGRDTTTRWQLFHSLLRTEKASKSAPCNHHACLTELNRMLVGTPPPLQHPVWPPVCHPAGDNEGSCMPRQVLGTARGSGTSATSLNVSGTVLRLLDSRASVSMVI